MSELDLIYRQEAIDALNVGAEFLRLALDDADVVGSEREKFEWGLGLVESYISDMEELPSAQPEPWRGEEDGNKGERSQINFDQKPST